MRPHGTPPDEGDRQAILRTAIAMTLAGNETGLRAFYREHAGDMAGTDEADDFEVVAGRFRYGASTYIRTLKASDRQQPGKHTTDEVVVHPSEPDVIWVRLTSSRKPRFGPAYVSTSWTRVTVTQDGSRVRGLSSGGVLHVA